jgi:uncharacterized protein (DUF924 family)
VIDDLDALVAHLASHAVDIAWDGNVPGVQRCYLYDPFGNRIELVASS